MGYRELIEALDRECEEKVRRIREETEAETGKIRAGVLRNISEMRARYDEEGSSEGRVRSEAVLSEAKEAARASRLKAEQELSDRLHQTAVQSLCRLRDGRYGEVFASLVHELPPGPWEKVKVNPEDVVRAAEFFPGAEVMGDPAIRGGLEVSGRDGHLRVVNTFEKRLERAWAEMLPEIMKDACRELSE